MSTISNRHSINTFVPGKSQPLTDQRLAKIGWKTTKKQAAKYKNICVSVPVLTNAEIVPFSERLLPFVRSMLADAQDEIVRSLYESSEGTLASVAQEEISIDSCINYLIADQSGDRLNAKMIGDWFDANVRDAFTVILCEQNKIDDCDDPRVVQTVNGYRGVVASINGRNSLNPMQRSEVRNLLRACEVHEDGIGAKIVAKLDEMEKVQETFKAALGFTA